MRPIKFRGQVIKDGRFVYGDLFQFKSKTAICTDIVSFLFEKKHSALVEVTPDSVAQLVGYDADGNEIYEGDEFFDIEDEEVTAKFSLVVTDDLDQFAGDIGDTFCNVKLLKENKK